jgi:uncharacterized membrane protein (UPF0127 family)
LLALIAPFLVALAGCSSAAARFQWHQISLGRRSPQCLPVAFTLAAQERGLQGVKRVVRPMVFAYTSPTSVSFWMKDTPSPLTGVWVGVSHRVIGYWHGQPESTKLHPSPTPIVAVIEYRAGMPVPALGTRFAIGRGCSRLPGL